MPRVAPVLLVTALLASGCKRDPSFVGYWEIVTVERQGQVQDDVGFLDFDGDGNVQLFSRYLFTAGAWAPDPRPELRTSGTNVFTQDDAFEAYQEEGETFDLRIDILQPEPLSIDDYHPWRAEVSGDAAWWPSVSGEAAPVVTGATGASGSVGGTAPTTLIIRR